MRTPEESTASPTPHQVSRRGALAAAWAVPTISVTAAAPAFAASDGLRLVPAVPSGDFSAAPTTIPRSVSATLLRDTTAVPNTTVTFALSSTTWLRVDNATRTNVAGVTTATVSFVNGATPTPGTTVTLTASATVNGTTVRATWLITYRPFSKVFGGPAAHHVLAVAGNKLFAWGRNDQGQLGNGTTTTNSSVPVAVAQGAIPAGVTIVEAAASSYHTLALGSDGFLYAWGERTSVGHIAPATVTAPIRVVSGAITGTMKFVSVTASHGFSTAVSTDGDVYSWGTTNREGQLGIGNTTSAIHPTLALRGQIPEGVKLVMARAGIYHVLALGDNGKVYAWGLNNNGQVGQTGLPQNWTPQTSPRAVSQGAVPENVTLVSISAGGATSFALGSNGKAYAWGAGLSGHLAQGNSLAARADQPAPVEMLRGAIPASAHITAVTAGGNHTLLVASDGRQYACGHPAGGQLGYDGSGTTYQGLPRAAVFVPGVALASDTFVSVAGGSEITWAVLSNGSAYACGSGSYGGLGNGATTNATSGFIRANAAP